MAALTLGQADRDACRDWIAHHSKSFYLSSLLLPRPVREASWALYAFCRRADDAVDDGASDDVALRRVEGLRRRLDEVYAGRPADHAVDRAFAQVVESCAMPQALPEALLAGMEMDARGTTRYVDDDALLLYCFRVASTVGLMMTRVMGATADVAWLRAADLGVAMQLTNIARDVGEDARRGRLYLPLSLCAEVGLDAEAFLARPESTPPVREAVRRLLAQAESHYRAADLGVPLLPRRCRLAIAASRRIYAAIGARVAAQGYDSVSRRAYVSLGGKLGRVALAVPALWSTAGSRELHSTGPADARLSTLVAACGLPVPQALATATMATTQALPSPAPQRALPAPRGTGTDAEERRPEETP